METFTDLLKINKDKLLKELVSKRKSLFDIRYKIANKQSKASHEVKTLKKSIAQILTALRMVPAEMQESLEKGSKKGQNGAATKKAEK
jgi:ribosomal protein L29